MKGIAVSVYDKFEDLHILIDIIRENWEDEYFIVVCCTQPEVKEKLSEIDADIVMSTDIRYSPGMDNPRGHIAKNSRIYESIRQAEKEALEAGCDYVMQLHADAWPLREEVFDNLIDQMEKSDAKAAVRGKGWSYRKPSCRIGHVMDQFFIIDANYFDKNNIWELSALEAIPDAGIHTMMALLFQGKVGRSNILYYSYMEEDLDCFGESTNRVFHTVRPSMYNPKYGFLHVAKEDFPDQKGEAYQAAILRKEGVSKGTAVQQLLDKYDESLEEIREYLDKYRNQQNRRLTLLLEDYRPYSCNFRQKDEILESKLGGKLKRLARNLGKKLYLKTHRFLFKLAPFNNPYFDERAGYRKLHWDTIWPERTENLYKENVQSRDFPEEYQDFWFKD